MKRNTAWLAVGLMLLVVIACSFGKRNGNINVNANTNSNNTVADASSTGAIGEAHMAKDNGKGDPGDETSIFSAKDRTIHCVVKLQDSKSGTKMKFSWFVVDTDNSKNEKIRDIDYTTRALENVVHAHLTAPRDWPIGTYKVEVYVNENLEKTVPYSVQ